MKPELYVDTKCVIGEGPVWDERTDTLYFVDLLDNKIYSYDGQTLNTMQMNENMGCAVLRENGGMVAGLFSGWYFVDFPEGGVQFIADPENGNDANRFNDGKVDPAGRFWTGTMPRSLDSGYGKAEPVAGLYCLDEKQNVKTMLSGVIQSNGLGWSKDAKQFYFIDTQRFNVQAFDYDIEKNELSNGRVVVEIPGDMGIPDGMTVDDEGNIWVALWGGSAVTRWDCRTGKLLEKIELPATNVTSCCFGGDNMDELFITTAAYGIDEKAYPLAGGVFRVKVRVRGAPSYRYKG